MFHQGVRQDGLAYGALAVSSYGDTKIARPQDL
jgi:Zn-dependent M16 (insulinase) family peptidase